MWLLIPAWDTCIWHQSPHMWNEKEVNQLVAEPTMWTSPLTTRKAPTMDFQGQMVCYCDVNNSHCVVSTMVIDIMITWPQQWLPCSLIFRSNTLILFVFNVINGIQIKICAEYRDMLPRPRLVCQEPGLIEADRPKPRCTWQIQPRPG